MERHHSVSSGHAQEDDSWTCQRCGWVYPNAHPSAKHRRNHKKHCGKLKGFEVRSELHKGGSSDEVSSGDDSHSHKATETGSAAPVLYQSNAPQSRDFLVNELNKPENGKLHTPFPQGTSASLDAKPEGLENESTRDITNADAVKIESSAPKPEPEPEPSIVLLDQTSKTLEEGQPLNATPADRVEEPRHISPESYVDRAKDIVKDAKNEDPPVDLTSSKPLGINEEHSKPHAQGIDTVKAAVHDSTGLDSDLASSAGSESIPPKYTENVPSLEAPSNISQDETKVTVTPSMNKGEIAARESQGLDADHVKRNGSLSKELGLHRQGSSQGDDSWTCRRCGWVYPNAHPSAKHRKKHKKQCGKVKGFELHTEPHNGGSSDEVSSDEDVHVEKEHIPHPPLQLWQPQDQANEIGARESLPSNVDQSATFAEGEGITESASNSLQFRESAAQVDAPDRELEETRNVKAYSTPDTVPSVAPEIPRNVPFLNQQNLLAGDDKEDVSDPDISLTKESPRHFSMKEDNSLNQVPSSPLSVDTLASENHGEQGKYASVEHGSSTKTAESPAGLLAERAPDATSIPSVSDLKSSDAPPPVHSEDNGACVLEVDKPNAVLSALDLSGAGSNNETSDASAGKSLNEEREKPGLSGLDNDTIANDPLRKDMEAAVTGGSTGQPESEKIPSDLSSHTLPVDEVPVENKSVAQNLLPVTALSAANGIGLANNEIEEGRFLDVQSNANPVQLVPKNELSAETVGGGNDDAVFSTKDKTDETPPVASTEHLSDNQMALSSIDKTNETSPLTEAVLDNQTTSIEDAPKKVKIPAVTSGEAFSIQRSLDEFPSKDNPPVAEGSGRGETGGNSEYTKIAKEAGLVDTAKESEVGGIAKGISSAKDGVPEKTEASGSLEVMMKPETKEETPPKTEGIESLEEMAKPNAKDETSPEIEGIASSELSDGDSYSFARSDSLVTAPSGFSLASVPSDMGALSHKFSDSLEIFEDAPDSLDTCSVGGSVDENESWDEPRQASGRVREEPEHLGAVSLEERVPSESVTAITEPKGLGAAALDEPKGLGAATLDEHIQGENVVAEQELPATNGSRSGEASSEDRASTLPGTSYGGRKKMEDLKAPSPEAWQEPAGPSNAKSEGKKVSTSEVTEDSKSGEGSSTALRNLMAKEGQDKAEPAVETLTPAAGNAKSSNRKEGSAAAAKGPKPKSRSFWRYCVCGSAAVK